MTLPLVMAIEGNAVASFQDTIFLMEAVVSCQHALLETPSE